MQNDFTEAINLFILCLRQSNLNMFKSVLKLLFIDFFLHGVFHSCTRQKAQCDNYKFLHVKCDSVSNILHTDLDRSADRGLVSMVVLASADALCAPVTPIMDWTPPP